MKIYEQPDDLDVFGLRVEAFPIGIKEAFDALAKTLGINRAYFGISWFSENDTIIYYAMAAETFSGEAKQTGYETLTIQKGKYMTETVLNWMSKTDSIKDVFHSLIPNTRPDKNNPCIEWYKSDDEMLCMVKAL